MVDEIARNHLTQQELDENDPARIFGQTVESDQVKRKREELAKLDAAELAPKEWKAGHAYEGKELRSAFSIDTGFDVFGSTDGEGGGAKARKKAEKKQRKEARAEKRERKQAKKQDKKRAKKAKKERRAAGR